MVGGAADRDVLDVTVGQGFATPNPAQMRQFNAVAISTDTAFQIKAIPLPFLFELWQAFQNSHYFTTMSNGLSFGITRWFLDSVKGLIG